MGAIDDALTGQSSDGSSHRGVVLEAAGARLGTRRLSLRRKGGRHYLFTSTSTNSYCFQILKFNRNFLWPSSCRQSMNRTHDISSSPAAPVSAVCHDTCP